VVYGVSFELVGDFCCADWSPQSKWCYYWANIKFGEIK